MQKVTNRIIRRQFNALTVLANRVLPSRSSELKVATLLRRYFDQPYQLTQKLEETIILRDFPAQEDAERIAPAILEARSKALNEMLELQQDIPEVPEHLRIKETDLPKIIKDNHGNQVGIADILASLGDLYEWPDDAEDK